MAQAGMHLCGPASNLTRRAAHPAVFPFLCCHPDWSRPISSSHPDTWDDPNPGFEAFVSDMVRHRLGKYIQPEHPSRITLAEAQTLHK